MPCPYFYPVARLEEEVWAVPPRVPLGDPYRGECRASVAFRPEDDVLRGPCNSGYARGKCARFPTDGRADAIRFHVASDSDNVIRLQFVFEKGCWPLEHGDVSYDVVHRAFSAAPGDDIVVRQASAFIESYLRRAR